MWDLIIAIGQKSILHPIALSTKSTVPQVTHATSYQPLLIYKISQLSAQEYPICLKGVMIKTWLYHLMLLLEIIICSKYFIGGWIGRKATLKGELSNSIGMLVRRSEHVNNDFFTPIRVKIHVSMLWHWGKCLKTKIKAI